MTTTRTYTGWLKNGTKLLWLVTLDVWTRLAPNLEQINAISSYLLETTLENKVAHPSNDKCL